MQLVQSLSRWRDGWDRFEAALGLVAAFTLAYGPLTVAALTLIFSVILAEWRIAAVAATITAVTCPMAIWLTAMAESALRQFRSGSPGSSGDAAWSGNADSTDSRERPAFAMLLAAELPALPVIARIPLAAWWLAHFAAGTALVVFADVLAREELLWIGFVDGIPSVVFAYLFHFAANVFLVLAITACFGSPAITARAWRKRFTLDALFTFPLLIRILF